MFFFGGGLFFSERFLNEKKTFLVIRAHFFMYQIKYENTNKSKEKKIFDSFMKKVMWIIEHIKISLQIFMI